ncbi:ABC transporter permease [Niabella drilacis]|uniref:ABC-2 type transport system permease protein n=1 Tax=Niabella drilacis (strain DSM 25811 / CCM 8410 / CCUG 62505 / LMG 26954 / E90) TaxID=1285928 RepID=A0A1G7B7G7_NIADE|nr:ABC transporter permease [Niabella drilacis]SDE22246.1 ABC-2 type transport system permease protein [Niabella drilacis]
MKNPAVYFKGLFSGNVSSRSTKVGDRPFSVMVRKEVADHIRSWRFIILLVLMLLTFLGSMYVSLSNISKAVGNAEDPDSLFLYLKLLTITDNSLPPFHIFVGFLGPLLGIGLGFDAVNAEQNNGTLIRLLAQPVYRDNLLLAKFTGALIVISVLFLSLGLLMIGGGLIITGVRIEPQEFLRILCFIVLTIVYVGFWLNLSILLSVVFKQAATSALTAIGIWLFFTVFYQMIMSLVIKAVLPDPALLSPDEVTGYNNTIMTFLRLVPSQLYADGTTTLLMPSVRSLGPLSMEQMSGAIPTPLSLRESLLIVWPQLCGLLAATLLCFALAYQRFMRREIRN